MNNDTAQPVFGHLLALTDQRGSYAQASGAIGQPSHGYRTEDMARVLAVATREPLADGNVHRLAGVAVRFLNEAQSYGGGCRNQMDSNGNWLDTHTVDMWWGQCIWALGTAAARSDVGLVRRLAVIQFERAAKIRSPHPKAMAFAAVGAAELLAVDPKHALARELIDHYVRTLAEPATDDSWPWPQPRLDGSDAIIAEALIAAGVAVDRPDLCRRGLDLLTWLLDVQTRDGHLSPIPAGGAGPGDMRSGFDQQPIDVAVLADACARAASVDASPAWPHGVLSAAGWFNGDNDAGQPMWNPETGAGFDHLSADGASPDQGAEAALAVLSTLQQARQFSIVPT